jgi:hypothetical protein
VVLPEVAAKLKRLLDDGATVVTGRFKKSPSLRNYPACDQDIAKISQELWDTDKYKTHLFSNVADAVKQLALLPDYEVHSTHGSDSVKVLHRRSSEADFYFVANRLDRPQNLTVDCRVQGKQPELWQAEDMAIIDAPVWNEKKDGRTSVLLSLGCQQTVFVVFRKPADKTDHASSITLASAGGSDEWSVGSNSRGNPVFRSPALVSAKAVYSSGKEKPVSTTPVAPIGLNGAWDISFAPKLGDPSRLSFPALADFSQHADPRVKYFSGTATYRKIFRLDASLLAPHRRVILDLGTMNDIATISINGSKAKVVWYAPYSLEVTSLLRPGDNELEIAVTNNWANALIGDEQIQADFDVPKPEDAAKRPNGFQLSRFPDWFLKGQLRPSARKTFTSWNYYTKDSEPNPAGLVGPVQLCIEQEIDL